MYWHLFWSFFKIGAFTFGGGYAMIPLIQKEVVDRKNGWRRESLWTCLLSPNRFPGLFP